MRVVLSPLQPVTCSPLPAMEELNPQQQEAVQTVEGPVLILAGAGSGKTRVITCRLANLIRKGVARPYNILAVTFTNKAASEMKSRVGSLLEGELQDSPPLISTYHSLCVRILRRFIDQLKSGYTRDFTIYDEDDQARVVRAILKDKGIDDKDLTARQVLSAISSAKNRRVSPQAYINQFDYANERFLRIAAVYTSYLERLSQTNALDFDDLLIKAVDLLRNVEDVRSYYHRKFRHVMVDEFQDTNSIQYELARLIVTGNSKGVPPATGETSFWENRSLCVVGDVDQSIYSWRGADFNIILNFKNDFENTKLIKLEQNYRSTETILTAANRVIENNRQRFERTLYATKEHGQGDPIGYYQSFDGEGEAAFVAEEIDRCLKRSRDTRIAVLYRANSQSRLFEESLRRRAIAYNIVGGFSFYERAEVKDIIAYLKLALNPADDIALTRVINSPQRGIGRVTLDTLEQLQRQLGVSLWETIGSQEAQAALNTRALSGIGAFRHVVSELLEKVARSEPLSEIVRSAAVDTGYIEALSAEKTEDAESRLLNIEELVNAAVEGEQQNETLRDFIDHAALVSDTDQYKSDARVTLLTIHAAKGLEFPTVFLVGLEEGLFPHSRATDSPEDMEEERRLCYVAFTRAQKKLFLSHAMQRRIFGRESIADPSPFLNEVPLDLLENLSRGPSWLGFATKPDTEHNRQAVAALRGEPYSPIKKTSNYSGQTYNSAQSVRDFFKNRETGTLSGGRSTNHKDRDRTQSETTSGGSVKPAAMRIGARVKHARYGRGVVLQIEGSGEDAKLTVSFPGFGQKKFIAKYATLESV